MSLRAPCAECGCSVSLATARAVVRGNGVALMCSACQKPQPVPVPESLAKAPVKPPFALGSWVVVCLAGAALWLVPKLTSQLAFGQSEDAPPPALLSDEQSDPDDDASSRFGLAPRQLPPSSALGTTTVADQMIELTWYHPLAGRRKLPGKADRKFGAPRDGGHPECGAGHCGVDIGYQIGEVVHAAAPGRVVKVVYEPDRRGGRYVKLEHDSGYATYYFHLDRVHPDLVPGIEIAAGEPVGLMGRSGIRFGRPHLHFAVSRRTESGERYVDPEPMLKRAILLDEPAPMPPGVPVIASTGMDTEPVATATDEAGSGTESE